MYRIYVLNPDHQFIIRVDVLGHAKRLARELVEKGYPRTEVWDAIIPVWSVWREGTRRSQRIHTSDEVVAYG
jgi:hypothetical protein